MVVQKDETEMRIEIRWAKDQLGRDLGFANLTIEEEGGKFTVIPIDNHRDIQIEINTEVEVKVVSNSETQ